MVWPARGGGGVCKGRRRVQEGFDLRGQCGSTGLVNRQQAEADAHGADVLQAGVHAFLLGQLQGLFWST
jgi:hypothetical protein